MDLQAHPISAAGFSPFGTLVSCTGLPGLPVNEGRGLRFDTGAALVHATAAAQPNLALYQIAASQWPVQVRLMERHRHSSQLFVQMSGGPFLIVVAARLANGDPDMPNAAAFTCGPDQGVVYAPGVWHLPLVALDQPAQFAMLMWEAGTPDDCDEFLLPAPVTVQPAPGVPR